MPRSTPVGQVAANLLQVAASADDGMASAIRTVYTRRRSTPRRAVVHSDAAGIARSRRPQAHIVDTLGHILTVLVTAANIQDRDAGHRLIALLRQRFANITLTCADSGYAGRLVIWARDTHRLAVQVVKRTDDLKGFVVVPRRWVGERTFAWLFTYRRLVHENERHTTTHETMVYIAMIMLMSRRLAKPTS